VEHPSLRIAMLSVHSCPIGELGTRDTGGMSVYIRELVRELGRRGHRVDVFTRIHDPRDEIVLELDRNVRLIHLRAGDMGDLHKLAIYPHLADFACALETFRRQDGITYDIVHSHYWLSGWVGLWAQKIWRVPHFVMFHTLGAVKNTLGVGEDEPELRIVTERQIVKGSHCVVAAREGEKQELMEHYGASPAAVAVVPCGVDFDLFRPIAKDEARRQLGVGAQDRILLYVGRIEPLKGIDRLLQAGARLGSGRVKVIIIGGDGHEEPEIRRLRELAGELGIGDSVLFAGRVQQEALPLYYSAADVLVVPSHYESFGLVALESLACGTPVVGTNVGAVGAVVHDGLTGYVAPDGMPVTLAGKISLLLEKDAGASASPASIRQSVARFSWSYVADLLLQRYHEALGGGRT